MTSKDCPDKVKLSVPVVVTTSEATIDQLKALGFNSDIFDCILILIGKPVFVQLLYLNVINGLIKS